MNSLYEFFLRLRDPGLSYSRYDKTLYEDNPALLKRYREGYINGLEFKPIDRISYNKLPIAEQKAYAHGFITGDMSAA